MPHGAKFAVSGVIAPSLIGAAARAELDAPKAVDPPKEAVSAARAPTAATNQNRFTDILLRRRPSMTAFGASLTGQSLVGQTHKGPPSLARETVRSTTG